MRLAASPAPVVRGRDAELASIGVQLDRVRAGAGAVVLVEGDAGMGKTRLLEVARSLSRTHEAWVLEATAFETDAIRPFSLWIDALRALDPALALAARHEIPQAANDLACA